MKTIRRNNLTAIQNDFEKGVCSDSWTCMAFGKNRFKIKNYFDDYTSLKYVSPTIHLLSSGNNGMTFELDFIRDFYTSNAVLKCRHNIEQAYTIADNLFYEYFAGSQFINKFTRKYPCFMETYGLFIFTDRLKLLKTLQNRFFGRQWAAPYSDEESIHSKERGGEEEDGYDDDDHEYSVSKNFRDMKLQGRNVLQKSLQYISIKNQQRLLDVIRLSCENPNKLCIMMEHFKKSNTLRDMLLLPAEQIKIPSYSVVDFVFNDLVTILFQIYAPLNDLRGYFSHNDLHASNILVYQPNKYNKHVLFHYHFESSGKVVSFKSKYLAKIIDYGRCFFQDYANAENSTTYLYNFICSENKYCGDNCGTESGYKFSANNASSNKTDVELLLKSLYDILHKLELFSPTLVNVPKSFSKFQEVMLFTFHPDYARKTTDSMENIENVFAFLCDLISDTRFAFARQNESYYADQICAGELHVYLDNQFKHRPMQYMEYKI